MFWKNSDYRIGYLSTVITWACIFGLFAGLEKLGVMKWDAQSITAVLAVNVVLLDAQRRGHERMVNKESGKE